MSARTRPIASPACRRSGTRRSPPMRCSKPAAKPAPSRCRPALEWLEPLQVLDVKGDWAAQRPDVRPGGWAFQYANPHYPDTRRHRRGGDGDGSRRPRRPHRRSGRPFTGDRARARMDRGLAEPRRRVGRLRRRQHLSLSQSHPLRRPRRAARPADRRRHGALRLDAGAARRDARDEPGPGARHRRAHRRSGEGRKLVRPLGHELRLRNLVGAMRAGRRRSATRSPSRCAAPSPGSSRIQNADGGWGESARAATGSITRATRLRPAPLRRRPGRCSG